MKKKTKAKPKPSINFAALEKKWQERWQKARIFEADPDKRRKFFTSFVIAYPSGDLHIGHALTFTRTDIIARFKRMQGYNTLAPMGFHSTGNRVVVATKRIKENDIETIDRLIKTYRLSKKQVKELADPEKYVSFFIKRGIETLKKGGFSIDWRRIFYSTEFCFNKFIEWQFRKLRKKGYVFKGSHPVIYCPRCKSPITQADRDIGEEAIITEFDIWKYLMEDGTILPAGTLRPETIFAITNMFVNPNESYVKARVGKETWIMGEKAAEKLKEQLKDLKIIEKIDTKDLIGKKFSNPVTKEKGLLILPGEFVDASRGTGVVASEPSDAPDDHIALEELKKYPKKLILYGLSKKDIEKIKYKPLIKLEGYGNFPAVELCKKRNITSLADPKLLEAKREIYKLQYHQGIMGKLAGELEGKTIPQAMEAVKKKYAKNMSKIHALSERVVCRCGAECYVKMLENQWFLKYGDIKWKTQVRNYLKQIKIYPEFWRPYFEAALEWTDHKACARKSGLGTPLPWDPEWIIETLSDSTIYMCFYIIAKFIKSNKIKSEQLTDSFFDYVLLGEGNIDKITKETKLSKELLKQIHSDFEYWYPIDWRNSAKDLVSNHLLYYIYNHIALFPKNKWPKTISVNGYVSIGGEKMSKSKGRGVTFNTAIEDYGADVTRAAIANIATPEQDVDWNIKEAENMLRWKLKFFDIVKTLAKPSRKTIADIDKWLLSKTMKIIKNATKNLEVLDTREAGQYLFYQMINNIRWYLRRSSKRSKLAKDIANEWVKMLSVYMPHICEELWRILGNKDFVSLAQWPAYDEKKIKEEIEKREETIITTSEDVRHILKIIKKVPKKIFIYAIPGELGFYVMARDWLSKEFGASVEIFASNDPKRYDPQNKAQKAKPNKPAIYVE